MSPRPCSKPSPAEIEQDLQTWIGGEDNAKTRAAYERLARGGAELLPKVREMIPPTWDTRRERLTALRYRLLMSAALAAALPQAPFQMAARDADLRAQALDAVAREVRIEGGGPDLQGFFVEAFNDPDSKVREAALRGLRETGAGFAKEQVLRLLADPVAERPRRDPQRPRARAAAGHGEKPRRLFGSGNATRTWSSTPSARCARSATNRSRSTRWSI